MTGSIQKAITALEGLVGYWTTSNDCLPSQEVAAEALAGLRDLVADVPDGLPESLLDAYDNCMTDGGSCAAESMEEVYKAATILSAATKGEPQ